MRRVWIEVDVVPIPRAIHLNGHETLYALERDPPPVHVVTVTSDDDTGTWREEVHGGAEICRLFVRGVRAGVISAGGSVNLALEWT